MRVNIPKHIRDVCFFVWRILKFWYIRLKIKTFNILEEIGESSGILAISLMVNRSHHWTERFLWFSLITLSVYAAYLISYKQLQRYIISPTVVSLDRDYRGWKGIMPAITLCYYDHLDTYKADEYIQSKWNISIADEEYFYFVEFLYAIVNATASNYVELARFATDERFEDVDLNEAISAIYRPFEQTLVSFNPWFKIRANPVMTERGRCYLINSPLSAILVEKKEGEEEVGESYDPLICEFGKQQCFIKMDVFESTGTIDVHSAYEISANDANIIALRKLDEVIATYKVAETVASEKLRELTPKQRKCVFADEGILQLPIYTKQLCLARCRAVMALEMCNCVPFFYPYIGFSLYDDRNSTYHSSASRRSVKSLATPYSVFIVVPASLRKPSKMSNKYLRTTISFWTGAQRIFPCNYLSEMEVTYNVSTPKGFVTMRLTVYSGIMSSEDSPIEKILAEGPNCNPAGFECLLDFKWPVWALHICNCPSTCTEMQYTVQSVKRSGMGGKERSKTDALTATFRWEVSPPKVRMRRDVVFSFEDLLVSFGGTLALFLGFSVLSIVYIVNVLLYNGFDGIWSICCFLWNICWRPLQRLLARCRSINQVNAIRIMAQNKIENLNRNNSSDTLFEYLE